MVSEGHSANVASLLQGPGGLPLLFHTFPSTAGKSGQTHLLVTDPFLGLSSSEVAKWVVCLARLLGQGTEARLPLARWGGGRGWLCGQSGPLRYQLCR